MGCALWTCTFRVCLRTQRNRWQNMKSRSHDRVKPQGVFAAPCIAGRSPNPRGSMLIASFLRISPGPLTTKNIQTASLTSEWMGKRWKTRELRSSGARSQTVRQHEQDEVQGPVQSDSHLSSPEPTSVIPTSAARTKHFRIWNLYFPNSIPRLETVLEPDQD